MCLCVCPLPSSFKNKSVRLIAPFVPAGLMVQATLAETALVPRFTLGFSSSGGLRAAFELRIKLVPFTITVAAYVQTYFIDFLDGE